MRLSPEGRDVGQGNPRRSNGQQGERAPLQENFRDWVLRYVGNAALSQSCSDTAVATWLVCFCRGMAQPYERVVIFDRRGRLDRRVSPS